MRLSWNLGSGVLFHRAEAGPASFGINILALAVFWHLLQLPEDEPATPTPDRDATDRGLTGIRRRQTAPVTLSQDRGMPEEKFVELVTAAHHYLTERQEYLRQTFGLSNYERWDWDGERGAVVFSEGGTPRVIATGQLVGSVSRKTGTWLWAWSNPSIEPWLRRDLEEVRRYGEHHGIWQLTTPKWEADETDGWEMTSIAAYVLQAKGAYRMPNEHLFSFAIFDEIAWVGGT